MTKTTSPKAAKKRSTRRKAAKKKPAKKKIKQIASKQKLKKRKRLPKDAGDIGLFKYRPVNKYLIDSLVKSQLHFSLPKELNDPYDCQVDLKRAIQRAADNSSGAHERNLRKILSDKAILKTINNLLRQTAVCSFSGSLLNPVAWSHYADEHRGVGLLYKIPQSLILDKKTNIVGFSGVEYGDDTLTTWLEKTPVKFNADYFVDIIKTILTIKGSTWMHEDEFRIMRSKRGQLDIDESYLTQICFGLRTPKSDKELIHKIVKKTYSKMNFCKIVVGDSDFGLEAKDI